MSQFADGKWIRKLVRVDELIQKFNNHDCLVINKTCSLELCKLGFCAIVFC